MDDQLTKQVLKELCTTLRVYIQKTDERLARLERQRSSKSLAPQPPEHLDTNEKETRVLIAMCEAICRKVEDKKE